MTAPQVERRAPQIVLITGLSGSGKTVALRVLEDTGYFCIDNLPARYVFQVIQELTASGERRIALNVDVRSGESFENLPRVVGELRDSGMDIRVLFLEASDHDLMRRFSETRRPHPLARSRLTLEESIARERGLLEAMGEIGHRIDTTDLSPNTLRGWVRDFVHLDQSRLTLILESFGFKHGLPQDADFVFDVRFLPNPYYDPRLRPHTGRDDVVIAFLDQVPAAQELFGDIRAFVVRWLPHFVRDNRQSLTVAIGCTGGQHRSVYLVEKLAAALADGQPVMIRHRQLRG